ncbi:MAG: translocation/assembly module TamB domain-containing protein [Fimbriimonadaceae bacterium]|nr:translocation/assembly module TamB domain-containing protein [Fimbriimonadaceae bacterium]
MRAGRNCIRVLLGLLRLGIFWLPAAVLALWGGAYAYGCLQALAGPAGPVDVELATPGGPLRIQVASYAWNLRADFLSADGVCVTSPEGRPLLVADTLSVRDVRALLSGGGSAKVRARGVDALLELGPTGRPVLLDYLPPSTDEPSKQNYTVEVEDVRLTCLGTGTPRPWRAFATIPHLVVDGAGDRWVATGRLDFGADGALEATVRAPSRNAVVVDVETERLELAEFLAYYKDTDDGRSVSGLDQVGARTLRISGPGWLDLPADGPLRADAQLAVQATGLAYDRYQAQEATFVGHVTHLGAEGTATARENGVDAEWKGAATWENGVEAAGTLVASAPDSGRLPKWASDLLPPELRFQRGRYEGWFGWDADGVTVRGTVDAGQVQWADETIQDVVADLKADTNRLSGRVREANYMGARVGGALDLDLQTRAVKGTFEVEDLSIARAARRLDRKDWSGTVSASALVGGSLDAPTADLRVRGKVRYDRPNADPLSLGNLLASARWEEGRLSVTQASLVGAVGVLSAEGEWTEKEGELRFEVFGSGFDLSALSPGLDGTGAMSATIVGTTADPRASGRLELYGVGLDGQVVPLVAADYTADSKQIVASRLEAAKGSARASGRLGFRFEDQAIFGELSATGVQLAELLGDDVTGTVDVPSLTVRGTLDRPLADGTVSGSNLLVYGTKIDSAHLTASADRDAIQLAEANWTVGAGRGSATGRYDLATREASFEGTLASIPIASLLSTHFDAVDSSGTLDGTLAGHITPDGLADLHMQGRVADLKLNDVPFGGGPWSLESELGVWSGNAMIGSLERFIEIPEFHYSQPDRSVYAEASAFQLEIPDLVDVVRRYVPSMDPALASRLDTLEGNLDAHAVVQGPIESAALDVDVLTASNLAIGETDLGTIDAKAQRSEGLWQIERVAWTGGPGELNVSGSLLEGGEVHLDGELSNFDLNTLSLIDSGLLNLQGSIENFSFLATGPVARPELQASLRAQAGWGTAKNPDDPTLLDLTLDNISIADGAASATGNATYAGLGAQIDAHFPFAYPFTVPRDQPFQVNLLLREHEMTTSEMEEFPLPLDTSRTSIRGRGAFLAGGTLDEVHVTGGVDIEAPTLALQDGQTSLQGFVGRVALSDDALTASASAASSVGGSATVNVSTDGGDVQSVLRAFIEAVGNDPEGAFRRVLETPLKGTVALEGLRVRHDAGSKGRVDAVADGSISVGGVASSPTLTGTVNLSKSSVTLPSEPLEPAPGGIPTIDPRFALKAVLVDPVELQATASVMRILGSGNLGGRLSEPDVSADLNVVSGTVKLPTARVALEPGGTLRLRYQGTSSGETIARLDVDLEGTTHVTALRFGEQVERYTVSLAIRGDLLDEKGVTMTASSDPPDLDSDRILRLLGQADLLEGLASALKPGEGQGQFQSALTSIALPALFDPITEKLAAGLGLDYLSLEYNSLDQTTISAAKSLGKGLLLSARRQLAEPAPGFPQRFEFRLSYRLPTRNRILGRTTLSIGVDQDRPWKISVEYGTRF